MRTAMTSPLPVLVVATAGAMLLATPAQAQKMTPGLWEFGMTMKGGAGGEMEAAMARMKDEMARMSPEQRKMMEGMMAGRGIDVGGGGKTITAKVCVTPEMAARDEMPQQQGQCRQTSQERSGNTLRYRYACSGETAATGEGEVTFVSDKQLKGRTVVNTTARGKAERVEMEQDGRWLAADCGEVKPRR